MIKKNSNDKYYKLLIDIIPSLKQHICVSGGEGMVYFISENMVVKTYDSVEYWEDFDKIFDLYCGEMQNFSNLGLNVPKVYAWTKIPNIQYYTKNAEQKFHYYILEERVHGRELYVGLIEDAYHLVKNICSMDEFSKSVSNYKPSPLYSEIVKTYIKDYIAMNSILEAMPENKLMTFLETVYRYYTEGVYGAPDLIPSNVFYTNSNNLTLIDPETVSYPDEGNGSIAKLKSIYLKNLVDLFFYNYYVRSMPFLDIENEKLANENAKVNAEAMKKMIKLARQITGNEKMESRHLELILCRLGELFDNEESNKIASILQK